MRELHVSERFGLYTVTTSDGRKVSAASLPSAMFRAFGERDWTTLESAFMEIQVTPEPGQIHKGVQGT